MHRFLTVALLALAPGAVFAGMIEPGSQFPAWELLDHTGSKVASSDLAGKTYLLWYYPKAMTPGCTAEGCALRDRFPAFQGKHVEVLGISFDDPEDNAKFVAEHSFPFRLLSDSSKDLGMAVGAADSRERKWARRISYLIGPGGVVLKAYESVDPRTHAAEVLADLESMSAER